MLLISEGGTAGVSTDEVLSTARTLRHPQQDATADRWAMRRNLPRIVTSASAREHGLTESAIRHGIVTQGWRRLGPGVVLTTGLPPTRLDLAVAGILLAGPGSALSGWDAVRIHRLGAATPASPTVLVLTRTGRHRRFGNIRIRPTRRAYDLTSLYPDDSSDRALPCAEPARAIADTALTLGSLKPVRALLTSAIQRNLCTPDDLARELAACPRNGSGHFRTAMTDVLNNAHSIAEAEAADLLVAEGAPGFEMNVPLVDRYGQTVRHADLLWRSLRAVLEVDSREFHFDEEDWQRTTERHNLLTEHGLAVEHDPPTVIRRRGAAWARRVHNWLRNRAQELGVRDLPPPGVIRPGSGGPRPYVLINSRFPSP